MNAPSSGPTVVVIGGGFSGSLFAMKYSAARPDAHVIVVERSRRVGRGLAYGACSPIHLLNVPVSRMELGLTPSFGDWLRKQPHLIAEALAESGGDLSAAYVSRESFGAYMEERVLEAVSPDRAHGFTIVRAEVVRLLDYPARGVLLHDGREIAADIVVLATGNLPPRPPKMRDSWLYDTRHFIGNPWAADAFADLGPDDPVVLLGTGLTMVDVVLKLAAEGHRGTMHAVSRRGLYPQMHKTGGVWDTFVKPSDEKQSPAALVRRIRDEVARAAKQDVPWQRVMDAMRPAVARIWHSWSETERAAFLRHLRPRWDVHRHRVAPRVASKLAGLVYAGRLEVFGGRVESYRQAGDMVDVTVRERGTHAARTMRAAAVINCTGPRSDMDRLAFPLLANMRRRGLIAPDPLGLGIETADCAAIGSAGHTSPWLYALGPLTRPTWWEITAVPEINLQVDRLVDRLVHPHGAGGPPDKLLADAFSDLGTGI
ncbi:MAG TPA: FAD/NAD(P)-binding protein [Rhizomicrobium sp.]|jgi:uncharacterized NAD(P)/FAD-binding protein YdhS